MGTLFLFLSLAFANPTSEWRFESVNAQGYKELFIMKKKGDEYFFNGKSLGKKLSASELKTWKVITAGPQKSKDKICPAGTYTFSKNIKKSKNEINGCLQGPAFAKYRTALNDFYNITKSRK